MRYSSLFLLTVLAASINLTGCGKRTEDAENGEAEKSRPILNDALTKTSVDIREAVLIGDLDRARQIVAEDRNLNLNYIYSDGDTLLITAIKNDRMEILELLIENGALIERVDQWGSTPLLVAVKLGHEGAARMLLNALKGKEELLNLINQEGDTALLAAIKNRNEKMALLLINCGANTEITDKNDMNALKLAENYELQEVFQLLKSKDQVESGQPTRESFLSILKLGNATALKNLIKKNPNLLTEYLDENLLVIVLQSQNHETASEMTHILLDEWVHPDGPINAKTTPLIEAIKLNRLYFAKLYLSANANHNKRDSEEKSPLVWAIEKNNQSAVRLLLSYSAITSYSLIRNGKRVTFNACDIAKSTRKTLKDPIERKNMDEIMALLSCGFSFF